jgi:hypothetical protein
MHIEAGSSSISDQLVGSPIMGGNTGMNEFIDPNMDPDIAEAIRMSLEEEK